MRKKRKRIDVRKGLIVGGLSVAWLIYQIFIFNNASQFNEISQRICEHYEIYNAVEWQRGSYVLAYMASTTPLLYFHLLRTLIPRMLGKSFKSVYQVFTGIIVLIMLIISMLMIPNIVNGFVPDVVLEYIQAFDFVSWNIRLIEFGLVASVLVELVTFINNRSEILDSGEIKKSLLRYISVLAISIFVVIIEASVLSIANAYKEEEVSNLITWLTSYAPLITGNIAMFICAPLMEELAFRAILFKNLDKYVNTTVAILFSALCWGIWHRDIAQFCYVFPLGILLAYVYKKTCRLRYPILIHGLTNLFANYSFLEINGKLYLPQIKWFKSIRLMIFDLSMTTTIIVMCVFVALILLVVWIGLAEMERE